MFDLNGITEVLNELMVYIGNAIRVLPGMPFYVLMVLGVALLGYIETLIGMDLSAVREPFIHFCQFMMILLCGGTGE